MWLSFLFGVIGGALGELLKWYSLRESPNLPAYLRSPFYWVVTVLMILAGGGLVMIHGVRPEDPWLAINIGISAPLILKGFASAVPVQPGSAPVRTSEGNVPFSGPEERREVREPNLVNFLAGR